MTRVVRPDRDRSSRINTSPGISGSPRSLSTTSNGRWATSSVASRPLEADSTSAPSARRRSVNTSRMSWASSMTRMRRPLRLMNPLCVPYLARRMPAASSPVGDCYTARALDALGASLIEGLEDAVVVTDARLTVVAWNAVMERVTGIARAAALGRPATEILDFLRDVDVASHLSRAFGGETTTTGDVRYEFPADERA